ncbi:unnamed protein product [Rotaria sordida]|uniref:Uncharacterized protein n=1 Tax=Rotaria sordida TaxID=392033 RepID=A0A820I643_9BILA|nr:unnamed protein product [Rotaria sordida]
MHTTTMYGRGRNNINNHSQYNEDEHDESSSSDLTLVMLIVHNLDHMMQPHEWEILLRREIHGARVRYCCCMHLLLLLSSLLCSCPPKLNCRNE